MPKMTAEEFILDAMHEGRLTETHIAYFVKSFQREHGLLIDGKPGIKTLDAVKELIEKEVPKVTSTPFLKNPLPLLADGRRAQITSEFRPKDRPNHNGVDFFYRWKAGDKPDFVGDHGCAGTIDGHPKWVVPFNIAAIAAAEGVVQLADNSPTGWRVWVDHGNGWRTGYFHLTQLYVKKGMQVHAGAAIGLVGDNPKDHDGRHLHFELSPVDHYAPVDPAPWFV